ncbi:cob(I)yrinic acid a,c-diamide adenosyltransferase [Niveibacterium sp. SC-1]|uniref:cob(I)yrinic acid a,c-diamide adenosyltransferase n=1 Tax=Niveibacterium sp. SC-1 TaxID=3135646 RepID=UPI00311E0857
MGNRLSRISTRTGDDGTTGLGDGTRVPKDHLRIHALGEVDELNSLLGVLLTEPLPEDVAALLTEIQHDLFDMGGELCIPGYTMLREAHVLRLDEALARYNAALPPLKEFILPGGARVAAMTHLARTVARRAERAVVTLAADEAVNEPVRQYLNRLSDLLFVLGRHLNRVAGGSDVLWRHDRGITPDSDES